MYWNSPICSYFWHLTGKKFISLRKKAMCYPLIFCSFRTYGEVRDGTDETEVRRHDQKREGRPKFQSRCQFRWVLVKADGHFAWWDSNDSLDRQRQAWSQTVGCATLHCIKVRKNWIWSGERTEWHVGGQEDLWECSLPEWMRDI